MISILQISAQLHKAYTLWGFLSIFVSFLRKRNQEMLYNLKSMGYFNVTGGRWDPEKEHLPVICQLKLKSAS